MKTVKIELEESYHEFLADRAKKNFRTIKATVEMIVQQYIDFERFRGDLKNTRGFSRDGSHPRQPTLWRPSQEK